METIEITTFCINAIAIVSPNCRSAKGTRERPFQVRSRRRTVALTSGVSGDIGIATAPWRNSACGVTARHFVGVFSNMDGVTTIVDNDDRETGRPQFGIRNLPHDGNVFQHNAWYVAAPCEDVAACDVVLTFDHARTQLNLKEAGELKKTH